ncbi:MAG: tetratricopeptide repeat protein [Planctomycetota bacterium]
MPLPPLDPDDAMIAARCADGRELGNALPDARQWIVADRAGDVESQPDALWRSGADLLAGLESALQAGPVDAIAVRWFVYSQTRRHDLVVTRDRAGTTHAIEMNGAARVREVGSLNDPGLAAVWLDSRRRFAGLIFELAPDRIAEALTVSREAFELAPTDLAGMTHAELLYRAGEVGEALSVWQALANAHPHYPPPLVRCATALLDLGAARHDQLALRMADAMTAIAAKRFADDADSLLVRARFLHLTSQATDARRIVADLLALAPAHAAAHRLIGEIALADNDWLTAETHWAECVRLDPDDDDARHQLDVVRDRLRG